ncbi:hypothetical protein [Cognataquiflexum aquatile]|uniref:hypothetical protein n=1 Tax=Cognataquiflexum aquatile TaxID=2249427 RepID=UPI000DEA8AD0|nr:hypothetical protein [Cognataquiflexum aquatile]
MIKQLLIGIFLSIPVVCYSQEFRVGVGIVNEQMLSNSEITTQDGLIISEENKFPTSIESFYVGYAYSFSPKFKANIGLQNTYNNIALFVQVPLPISTKIRTVRNNNFEFPIEVSYVLFKKEKFNFKLRGGLVPVWSVSRSLQMTEVPEGPDWSQEVVDALNAAETIPKSFYMNYQYGLALSYGRLEFSLFQSANLSRSISNGYTLNGTTYPFDRRISSTRIGLYYSIWLKKEKE